MPGLGSKFGGEVSLILRSVHYRGCRGKTPLIECEKVDYYRIEKTSTVQISGLVCSLVQSETDICWIYKRLVAVRIKFSNHLIKCQFVFTITFIRLELWFKDCLFEVNIFTSKRQSLNHASICQCFIASKIKKVMKRLTCNESHRKLNSYIFSIAYICC